MVIAKCTRCLGSGTGSTFKEASSRINHGVGLTRGVPCGASFKRVIEVDASPKPKAKKPSPKPTKEKSSTPISEDTKE